MEEISKLPFPEAFLNFLEANGIDPSIYTASDSTPRYLRLKPGSEAEVEEIEAELKCKLEKVKWLPGFYSLPPDIQIANSKAYQDGQIYGIDAASGAAVSSLRISQGDHILDLCAAPGAKLCMMLDLLGGSGSVTGVDVARHRLAACRTMLQKYSLGDRCRLFVADGTTFSLAPVWVDSVSKSCDSAVEEKNDKFREWTSRRPWKERKSAAKAREAKLVAVLVDAECTHDGSVKHIQKFEHWGWRTLQRRVLDAERKDSLTVLQLKLLTNGFRLLKVGGLLVYSTCSLTFAQNEEIVEHFLKENASAEILPFGLAELQEINEAEGWPSVYLLAFDITGSHGRFSPLIFAVGLVILLATPLGVPLYSILFKPRSNSDIELPIKEPLLVNQSKKPKTTTIAGVKQEDLQRKRPLIWEDHTITEMLQTFDFCILFVSFLCGVGTGMCEMNNMGQMGLALGYSDVSIFVSLTGIWGFFGRIASGLLSEYYICSNLKPSASSLRWGILRRAVLHRAKNPEDESQLGMKIVSRKVARGFNLIPCQLLQHDHDSRDARLCYTLPIQGSPKLVLTQRVDNNADLSDFEMCNRHNIDNTGLVCQWPSEDVLAYFCLSHADMFRSKRVIELGSGYGLAGLAIAAATEALEVVISDGNPQVVDYIQHNIKINSGAFGDTRVKSMKLHWHQKEISNLSHIFDVIVASDCTFFKEFHKDLARITQLLLKNDGPSEAIFFSPKRGNSLDKFLEEIEENGLFFSITESYDTEIWNRHQQFMNGDDSWPGYEKDHCYPLLIRITR
ncbi:hypothetical protein REPUB_Repub10bG0177100 [Reevesia pubescens]